MTSKREAATHVNDDPQVFLDEVPLVFGTSERDFGHSSLFLDLFRDLSTDFGRLLGAQLEVVAKCSSERIGGDEFL